MTDKAISPLRQRLTEDMAIRRLGPKTQQHYIRHVKRFADFLGHSADKATAEDVHRYQLWLASIGTTVPTVNVSATALRFFFKITLKRRDLADAIVSVREPRRLRSQPGRGRSASRVDGEHQAQGGPEPNLCHRPAVIGGRIAEAHRYRQ
jgi:site-specific recombinase XerD